MTNCALPARAGKYARRARDTGIGRPLGPWVGGRIWRVSCLDLVGIVYGPYNSGGYRVYLVYSMAPNGWNMDVGTFKRKAFCLQL